MSPASKGSRYSSLLLLRCNHYSLWNTTVTVINGTQVAQDISEQINSDLLILTSSLQRNTDKAQQLYEALFTCSLHSFVYQMLLLPHGFIWPQNEVHLFQVTTQDTTVYIATDEGASEHSSWTKCYQWNRPWLHVLTVSDIFFMCSFVCVSTITNTCTHILW